MGTKQTIQRECCSPTGRVPLASPIVKTIVPEGSQTVRAEFRVDDSLPGIREHFPAVRILAGYFQLLLVDEVIRAHSAGVEVSKIIDMKCSAQIPASSTVVVECEFDEPQTSATFLILHEGEASSKGRVSLRKRSSSENVS